MKKYLKVIGVCIFIGGIIAYFFYKDINNEVRAVVKKEEIVILFQTGVFENESNAEKFAKTFASARTIYNDGYYRVIIAACYSKEVMGKLESIFNEDGISYYIKEVRVSKQVVDSFKEFEPIILKSNKKEVIYSVINSMLKLI